MASTPQGRHVSLGGSQALAAPNPFPAPPYWPPAQLRSPPWLRVPVPRRCVCPARLRKLPICSSVRGAALRVPCSTAFHRTPFRHQLRGWPSPPSRKRAEALSGVAGGAGGGQGRHGQRLPWTEGRSPRPSASSPTETVATEPLTLQGDRGRQRTEDSTVGADSPRSPDTQQPTRAVQPAARAGANSFPSALLRHQTVTSRQESQGFAGKSNKMIKQQGNTTSPGTASGKFKTHAQGPKTTRIKEGLRLCMRKPIIRFPH